MSDIGQFTDFIKGSLDADSEQAFFDMLAADGGLRTEFRTFLSIADSVRNNRKAFAPSAALTASVFSAVGMALPVAAHSGPEPVTRGGIFASKAVTIVSTSFITLLLSLGIAYYLFDGMKQAAVTVESPAVSVSGTVLPVIGSIASDRGAATEKAPERVIVKYVLVKDEPTGQTAAARNQAAPDDGNPAMLTVSEPGRPIVLKNIINIPQVRDYPSNTMKTAENDMLRGLAVEFSGNASWNLPEGIMTDNYSAFHNMNLAVTYKFNESLKAGAGVNCESFYAEYEGTDPDGSTYLIRQQPEFISYDVFVRYFPFGQSGLSPFGQMGAAINQGGFVLRPSLGLEYFTTHEISLFGAVEYNCFWYQHQGIAKSPSSKINLKYGISYNF